MKNNILIDSVKKMSSDDLKSFQLFVKSPFFNSNQKAISLIDYIVKNIENFQDEKLEKEAIYFTVFDKKKFDNQQLKNLMSHLLKLLVHFFSISQFQKNKSLEKLFAAKGSMELDCQKLFQKLLKKVEKDFDETDDATIETIQLSELKMKFQSQFRNRSKALDEINFQLEQLDAYFKENKLRLECEKLSMLKMLRIEPKSLSSISQKKLPRQQVWKALWDLLNEKDSKELFENYVFQLKTFQQYFDEEALRNLFTAALNFCTQQINSGNQSYLIEYFKLHKELIVNGLIFEKGQISQWAFQNVVTAACRVGELDWGFEFIHSNKNKLREEHKINAFSYALAIWYFHAQKFDEAIQLLNEVKFTDVYYAYNSRLLLARLYFERKDWWALDSFLNSFRLYLLREKKLTVVRKKACANFIRLVNKMKKIHEAPKRESSKILAIKKKIKETSNLILKNWLLQKIEELEKR